MAIERPTFHEAWYRVAELKTRLLSSVKVSRQSYRGQLWYVLENVANNTYSRLDKDAYYFVGLLDGRRTVTEAWRISNERLGDRAPTQGEAIQILGQLYAGGLLYADLPPDAQMLFRRHQSRVRREVRGQLMSLLYLRVPLLDPDPTLERWVGLMGLAFTWPGLVLWLALVATGLYFVVGDLDLLSSQSSDVLSVRNLPWLYLCYIVAKILHEFGHAFACKRFGQLNPGGGQVPTLGIMFMVFFPTPYVDASSAWVFRSRWHRAIVGMAGVMTEVALAAVAAVVWANTSVGTLHSVAYNLIFVASVSTFLFNANPLLRFDAYYVLADLLEIPNLGQRSSAYLSHLAKRYVWGMTSSISPAYSAGEALWFVFYGIASGIYRVYISIQILLFMNDRLPEQLFFLVPCMAVSGLAGWILVPAGKLVKFLATSGDLAKKRPRAVLTTLAAGAAVVTLVGWLRLPDHWRVEGIVEPNSLSLIYAETDGFVETILPSDVQVEPGGRALLKAVNPQLEAQRSKALAERRRIEVQRRIAQTQEPATVQMLDEQVEALDEKVHRVESQLTSLRLQTPLAGMWLSPQVDRLLGLYVHRGERLGLVGRFDDLIIRATAGQNVAAMALEQAAPVVEMRIPGRPDKVLKGRIVEISPEGRDVLPSQALGFRAGGAIAVKPDDPNGLRTAERVFEIRIQPDRDGAADLRAGHRVVIRMEMHPKCLLVQWWTTARQVFQRRFYL